jgi:hypothetical protein
MVRRSPAGWSAFEPSRRYAVEQLSKAFGVAPCGERPPHPNILPDDELIRQTMTCEAFHTPLVQLAARLVGSGDYARWMWFQSYKGIMDKAADNLENPKRRKEWQQRRDAIPRYVQSAVEKYSNAPGAKLKTVELAWEWPDDRAARALVLTKSRAVPSRCAPDDHSGRSPGLCSLWSATDRDDRIISARDCIARLPGTRRRC